MPLVVVVAVVVVVVWHVTAPQVMIEDGGPQDAPSKLGLDGYPEVGEASAAPLLAT